MNRKCDTRNPGAKKPGYRKSRRRLWMMTLVTVLLVPAFFLAVLEGALRLTGFGYSTDYWKKSIIDGETYLIPNHTFTYRFFPPALARAPLPQRILPQKPEGTYRVFLFGESAAYGDPDPAYGVGRYLEILLEARYPGSEFEVICTAMTAINSHAIVPIARECADLDGDLWILYMGNNEMIGAYGASTNFSAGTLPLPVVRLVMAVKATRIGQLVGSLVQGGRKGNRHQHVQEKPQL